MAELASKERAMNVIIKEKLDFSNSRVQERMMRIGIEARHVHRDDIDELVRIAVKTLKEHPSRTLTDNIEALFAKQRAWPCSIFYFLDATPGKKLEVLKCDDLSTLEGKYYGELPTFGMMPRLYARA